VAVFTAALDLAKCIWVDRVGEPGTNWIKLIFASFNSFLHVDCHWLPKLSHPWGKYIRQLKNST